MFDVVIEYYDEDGVEVGVGVWFVDVWWIGIWLVLWGINKEGLWMGVLLCLESEKGYWKLF